jgi:hypothetical protein
MKRHIAVIIGIIMISGSAFAAQKQSKSAGMPAGGPETVEAKITKVYFAEDSGSKFLAYVVNWKGQEVVIMGTPMMSEKKVGDAITIMSQRMGSTMQFMIMEAAPAGPYMGAAGGPMMPGIVPNVR